MAASSVWADMFVRGPACRPSVSGRHSVFECVTPLKHLRVVVSRRSAVTVRISSGGIISLGARTGLAELETAPSPRPLRTWTIEESEDDGQVEDVAQPSNSKTLKINVDLLLVSKRLKLTLSNWSAFGLTGMHMVCTCIYASCCCKQLIPACYQTCAAQPLRWHNTSATPFCSTV